MAPLPIDLRNQLARAIQNARREAEEGARKALQSLAVDLAKAHDSMDKPTRDLRGRLRAHGKQLGDLRNPNDTQVIDRLAHEVAYEHWHRMLFARFLAENRLLIEPTTGVAISMEECEELARKQGRDPWALAASYAQAMLPKIFRADDPVLDVQLPPETRLSLERHLESLPALVFTADDALGWTYQFWQTERKDAVNRAGGKIGADELPAVTQLFTEHYMVLFLFHNTVGAWHAGKVLAANPKLASDAKDEDELREAVRLKVAGGYDFSYLRFVRGPLEGDAEGVPTDHWRPAAGTFDGWPRNAAELRALDPCCGSGHFLVEGFELLVRLRIAEEGLSLDRAIAAVLTENLFGLEIDARCTQIAAFNLALAAWKLLERPIDLPTLNIACSGLAVSSTRDEWMSVLKESGDPQVRFFFGELHTLFAKAPTLGSLTDPRVLAEGRLSSSAMERLLQALGEAAESDAPDRHELGVAAQGLARAAELLASRYSLVITNVPYLGRGSQSETLKGYIDEHFSSGKSDLATAFVLRSVAFCEKGGTAALVTPQNWLFLTTYKQLREASLRTNEWNMVAKLGAGAFETISGEVVNVALLVLSRSLPTASGETAGIDASRTPKSAKTNSAEKAGVLRGENGELVVVVTQADQLTKPDARITLESAHTGRLLGDYARAFQGTTTGDNPHFIRDLWEVPFPNTEWVLFQAPVEASAPWGGCYQLIWLNGGGGELSRSPAARVQGQGAWGKSGLVVGQMSGLEASLYTGTVCDMNSAVIVPTVASHLSALWMYASSPAFKAEVRKIDQNIKVTNATFEKVPFDLEKWTVEAAAAYPAGLPQPETNDPTQWLFHGRPELSLAPLQVAVARTIGYRWPAELDDSITLSSSAMDLVKRCGELAEFADDDGVVCIPSVRGDRPAADRLLAILSRCGLKPDRDLDEWLRNEFFEEHCKLFHHRPFIWHIWDGRPDGFHALVNYHRLAAPNGEGRRTLQALTFSYLGDWIDRQKADQRDGKEGSDARLAAAQDLQAQLEKILTGEPPYDIFVRWKPLSQQPIGWDPDINDGVRLNIRPFMSVELHKGGRAGAGILRWKPNINWKKDRGTEPQSIRPASDYPWFWDCPGEGSIDERTDFTGGDAFDGCRWNDLHYGAAVKGGEQPRKPGSR
jgi:hypothetical protein